MASVQPMSEDLDLLTIEHMDLSSFQPMMGHLSGIREVATEQPDDAGQEMASSQSSSDDQSPCEDNQMTDAEKKRERRKKQKRDYATRKRVKDKKKTEALEKKRTSLLSQREQSEREIHQLKALHAYCMSYMSLLKASCTCQGQTPSPPLPPQQQPPPSSPPPSSQPPSSPQSSSSASSISSTQRTSSLSSSASDEPSTSTGPAYDAEMIDFLNLDLTTLHNIAHMLEDGKKGVPGENYSNFPDDISSLDCTNRAPLPAVYPDCREPVTISPQNSSQFWIDAQAS